MDGMKSTLSEAIISTNILLKKVVLQSNTQTKISRGKPWIALRYSQSYNSGNQQCNFVLYARACGRKRSAILRHIFRNSLQSSLTALGMSLPKLVAGTFVVECIFAWPGLGRLCVTAIFNRDFPVIQAYVLLMAVLFVLCNLAMDICSALVDPRLREGGLR